MPKKNKRKTKLQKLVNSMKRFELKFGPPRFVIATNEDKAKLIEWFGGTQDCINTHLCLRGVPVVTTDEILII